MSKTKKSNDSEGDDHDQRFKKALKGNFAYFMEMFFPKLYPLFDFDTIEWQDKEYFVGDPKGELLTLDMIAKLKTNSQIDPKRPKEHDWYAIVHIDVESRDSTDRIDRRIIFYFLMMMFDLGFPILPIVLFIKMKKDGIGEQVLYRNFSDIEVLKFTYQYVALGGLDPLEYLEKENPLGWAFTSLMKSGGRDPAEVATQAVQQLNEFDTTDLNRTILLDVLGAYLDMSEEAKQEIQKMIYLPPPEKLVPDNETKLARYIKDLRRDTKTESILRVVAKRFGAEVANSIASEIEGILDMDKLNLILDEAVIVHSVEELRKLWA